VPVDDERVGERLDRLHDDGRRELRIRPVDLGMPSTPRGDLGGHALLDARQALPHAGRERRLLEQHAVQRRLVRVQGDHRAHEARHHVVQRGARVGQRLRRRAREQPLGGGQVLLEQRDQQRVLVREVLVERADGHAGERGDVIGGRTRVAAEGEDPSCRLAQRPDGVLRPVLARRAAGLERASGAA